MAGVLIKAAGFAFIICIGIFARSSGLVPDNAGQAVKKILLTFTLPAALITSFSRITDMSAVMLVMTLIGLIANVIMMFVGYFATARRSNGDRAMYMLSVPAFNIGAFCLPFVQEFLPALGTATACMFDAGNSFMCTGGTYAIAGAMLNKEDGKKGINWGSLFKNMFKSVPFDVYVTMFILTLTGVHLPEQVLNFIAPLSNANACMAMLMIGLTFHLEMKKDYIGDIFRMILLRQIFAIVLALFCYNVLPFDLIIRQTLVLLSFGPMSAIAPAFTSMLGGDEGKASAANSISIILSVIEITVLLIVLGIY